MELRPYQEEARQAIHEEWDQGHQKTLLVLPTGTGKTVVFSKVVEDRVRSGDRALILAHRGELLDQAADKLSQLTGLGCAVEKAEQSSMGSPYRVTVGSVQTLMRQSRLDRFPKDYYETIVVDEAHHALSDSYRRILDHFDESRILGVTATPDRGDLRNLGEVFDSLAYEYDLRTAIHDKYLSPIKALTIPLEIDLSGVGTSQGDFKVRDVGHAIEPYLDAIADEIVKNASERKTVIFLPLIATSQKMTGILQAKGVKAAEVNGESTDREQILKDFDRGRYQVLCNSMLLTEGWDCPSVDCIVVLRPTKIRSLYAQMVGRGTRLNPGKDNLLILDFLWHSETHMLCKPASLIAKSDDVSRRMTELMDESPEAMDLEEAAAQAESDVVEERENSLAEKLAEMRKRKRKLVDPLQYGMSISAEDLINYQPAFGWESSPPTDAQKKTLEQAGIFPDEIENAGMASILIGRLQARRAAGLATPKQIRLLERYGFRHVGQWELEAATKMISRIAASNWRVPRGVVPQDYQPAAAVERYEYV